MRIVDGILAASLALALAAAGQEPSPHFTYTQDAGTVILGFEQRSGYMHWGEPHFGLKLYGDGRVVASLPKHFPKAVLERRGFTITRRGDFETRLTPQEVEALLRDAEPALDFDLDETQRQRSQQHPGRARTDGGLTTLSIQLSDYRPAQGDWSGPIDKAIRWKDVSGDAELYPNVVGIQALAAADRALPLWIYRLAERVDKEERGQ